MSIYKPSDRVGADKRFVIEEFLNKGGWGEIYKARDTNNGRVVALKVLHSYAENAVARFKQEAFDETRICETERGKQYVVNVLFVSKDESPPYLAMEYLDGKSAAEFLRDILRSGGRALEPTTAVELILPACLAIAEAHACGIVHRDLSLDNLFVVMNPDHSRVRGLKVIDFGMSLSSRTTWTTNPNQIVGTIAFVPPERLRPKALRPGSGNVVEYDRGAQSGDQYALAVGLYQLLTGHSPFESVEELDPRNTPGLAERMTLIQEEIREGKVRSIHNPDWGLKIPAGLGTVIARAMATNPARRFDSVFEFGEALLEFASPRGRAIYEREFEDEPEERVDEPLSLESSRIQSMRIPVPRRPTSQDAITVPNPQPVPVGELPTMAYRARDEERLRIEAGLPRESIGSGIATAVIDGASEEEVSPASSAKHLSALNDAPTEGRRRRPALLLGLVGVLAIAGAVFKCTRGDQRNAAAPPAAPTLPAAVQSALEEGKSARKGVAEGSNAGAPGSAGAGESAASITGGGPVAAASSEKIAVAGDAGESPPSRSAENGQKNIVPSAASPAALGGDGSGATAPADSAPLAAQTPKSVEPARATAKARPKKRATATPVRRAPGVNAPEKRPKVEPSMSEMGIVPP
jgi:serine/threonine protein kinase